MKGKYLKWGFGVVAIGAVGTLLDAFLLEKYFFDLKTYNIGKQGQGKRLKLVLLTDMHFKEELYRHHRKLASTINQLQPDLIMMAGDTLDTGGRVEPVAEFLRLLSTDVHKVAIPGNHDHKSAVSISQLKSVLEQYNGHLLVNESKCFQLNGQTVMVTGLDDFIEGVGDLEAAVEKVGFEENHLLLLHSPLQQKQALEKVEQINKVREASDKLNIRYIFAGHNHGGQVRLPDYVPVLPGCSGDYVNGWYNDKPPFLYVSKGFGTSAVPFRFFARSEVILFNYYV